MGSGVRQACLGELSSRAITDDRDVDVVLPEMKREMKSSHACADGADALLHDRSSDGNASRK